MLKHRIKEKKAVELVWNERKILARVHSPFVVSAAACALPVRGEGRCRRLRLRRRQSLACATVLTLASRGCCGGGQVSLRYALQTPTHLHLVVNVMTGGISPSPSPWRRYRDASVAAGVWSAWLPVLTLNFADTCVCLVQAIWGIT